MLRWVAGGGLVLLIVGFFFLTPPGRGQQQPPGGRRDRPERAGPRPEGRGPGRGGPPPPPLLSALDKDGNGEISAQELQAAVPALKLLDKNRDGELAGSELEPTDRRFGGRRRGGFPFGNRGSGGPRLAPEQIKPQDGAARLPDHGAFHRLAYKGEEVMIDTFLAGLEFVKFTLDNASTPQRQLYFINTKTHRAHMMFARAAGLEPRARDQMKGVLVYRPLLQSPTGKPGLYTFEFEPFDAYPFRMIKIAHDALVTKMPALKGNIGYYPRGERAQRQTEADRALYRKAGLPIYTEQDLTNTDIAYLPLNPGLGFGRLRLMESDQRPGPRDIVLYRSLPNELPRVAGVITSVRQTPLSHVNLRAVQDRVPNAYIKKAAEEPSIKPLLGRWVAYHVTADGFEIRAAQKAEVDAHFSALRPSRPQSPPRDLSERRIRPLSDIKFSDGGKYGVKAANLATLRTFGFPEGVVPNGHAVPFSFYDAFMKHNGVYEHLKHMLDNPEFRSSSSTQQTQLKNLRRLIRKGRMPDWMTTALTKLQKSYPANVSLRCRSSTNNEDLPGFSGAGLYGSYTHRPDEGPLAKSIKQVFASLWNFRAFEEREFYRVDHFKTAMGVLVHPNYKGERANGVAVTADILYQTTGNYYLNVQVGEDLVTNPDEASAPEEGLLDWWDSSRYKLVRSSNRSRRGGSLLSESHRDQLRAHLGRIHGRFARLYGKSLEDEKFAMEIEFKITKKNKLVIKQARPWVFASPRATTAKEASRR